MRSIHQLMLLSGNHEADVGFPHLIHRIKESKFKWVNTNISDLKLPADSPPVPDIIEIEAQQGDKVRRIALLGLITEDPTLYLKGAFGGATILPLIETAKRYFEKLTATGKYDAIIPLTHETIEEDRKLSKAVPFPVIIGGHDHDPYNEIVGTTHILKTGMDANSIGIIELTWPDINSKTPLVSITMRPAQYYAPDPLVQKVVAEHMAVLELVKKAPLFDIPNHLNSHFSSTMIRSAPSPVATMLLTIIRKALGVDCVLVNAGCIRASKDYSALGQTKFFYSDLEAEMPFESEIVVLPLPGRVIIDIIQETRAPAFKHPPESLGRFCQTDDSISWDPVLNQALGHKGKPIDPNAMYTVATLHVLTGALQESPPLLEYVKTLPTHTVPDIEACISAKQIIIGYLSKFLLFSCIETLGLSTVTGGDDQITKEEMFAALEMFVAQKQGENVDKEVISLLVNDLFDVADLDGSGKIDKKELIALRVSLLGDVAWSSAGTETEFTTKQAEEEIARALGISDKDPTIVDMVFKLDKDKTGKITLDELRDFVQTLISDDKKVLVA